MYYDLQEGLQENKVNKNFKVILNLIDFNEVWIIRLMSILIDLLNKLNLFLVISGFGYKFLVLFECFEIVLFLVVFLLVVFDV